MELTKFVETEKMRLIERAVDEYKTGRIKQSKLLAVMIPLINKLLSDGYRITEVQTFLENAFGIKLKYDALQKWIKRNAKKISIHTTALAGAREKNEVVKKTAPKKTQKPQKEKSPVEKMMEDVDVSKYL